MGSGDPPGLQNRCAAGLPVVVRFNPETLPPNTFVEPGATLEADRFAAIIRQCRNQACSSSMIVDVSLARCSARARKKQKGPARAGPLRFFDGWPANVAFRCRCSPL